MPRPVPLSRTLEELENNPRPPPTRDGATGLVLAVPALRERPVGSLTVDDLTRPVGQYVGLLFLLPLALRILRDTLPAQRDGGWHDEDLPSVVLTRGPAVRATDPECAHDLRAIVACPAAAAAPYLLRSAERFRASLPAELARSEGAGTADPVPSCGAARHGVVSKEIPYGGEPPCCSPIVSTPGSVSPKR
ncbi:contact-dependent growth inhibition system immunity protein [Streptomyces sp. NPDC057445]|uniref:contact-dependent growth inhibition system immunity protein n=1 Tax=Streptomyces sp. NPDC057445 TaxID=3346136 RepID=UPI0036B3E759